jgi:hypothetical protein
MQKPILILIPYSYWKANPTIFGVLNRLQSMGMNFLIVSPLRSDDRDSEHQSYLPDPFWNPSLEWGKKIKLLPWIVCHFTSWLKAKKLLRLLRYEIAKQGFSQIIAIDPQGLCVAKKVLTSKNSLILNYLSFEIIFKSEALTKWQRDLFEVVHEMNARVSRILVQDIERRDHLIAESKFKTSDIHLVPVAPEIGLREEGRVPDINISSDDRRKMILYCGNIENWNIKDRFDEIMGGIPSDYYLRIHTHFPIDKKTRTTVLRYEQRGLLDFSQGFMDESEHITLLRKAFLGLAPYVPQTGSWMTGKNLYHLGLSSSKISYFCALGIPVLTSLLPSLKFYNDIYNFGELFSDWDQIPLKIKSIEQNYNEHSRNARNFYEQVLDPKQALDSFCKALC